MDPHPGGPKTNGSYLSGSATLISNRKKDRRKKIRILEKNMNSRDKIRIVETKE
jgi:hypothetical protein